MTQSSERGDDSLDGFFVTPEERRGMRNTDLVEDSASPEYLPARDLMTFWVAGEEYALALHEVQEIIKMPIVTRVPRVQASILGVIALRGTIVPLLDLRRLLRLPEAEVTRQARVLVLRAKGDPVGVLVDQVTSVLRLDAESIEPTPVTMQRDVSDLIQAVGRTGERMIIILDPGAILRAVERAT